MIRAWGQARYESSNACMTTEDSGETGSGDDLPQSSIDWLVLQDQKAASAEHGENQEYLFMEIEEGPETGELDYTATYLQAHETLATAGEQPVTEERGEMLQKMRETIVTINYRKTVPIIHFYPDEEPLKKELKQGPTLLEATRIDQAITNLDEFL
jgi:hypothetical protein